MSKHLNELKDIISLYEKDTNLRDFIKKLYSLSILIEIEAAGNFESPVLASNYEDDIVYEFLNRNDSVDLMGTSGFIALDRITGGFKNGEFIILAGLENMGKTLLMIEIANHWASKGKAVGYLNLEESTNTIVKRILLNIGRFSPAFFNKELVSQEANLKLTDALKILKTKPIYLYENPSLDLNKLIIQIKKMVVERKVQIIFVDYLELIIIAELSNKFENSRTIICRKLKQLAVELNIVLIISSKLPKNSYSPTLHENTPVYCELVSKGFIEPNTYTIIVHRNDYFDIEKDENNQPTKNRMELVLAKYSTGQFCEIPLKTDFDKSRIMDFDYTAILT